MKLQILVPHYKETAEVIKPLLDSLSIQQNIDFSEMGVIVCHDGDDSKDFIFTDNLDLVKEGAMYLPNYPFEVKQIRQKHNGVSAARNSCLDKATADYVMFCDCDDMFYNACGVWILFREMDMGVFDSLVSVFIEETRLPETQEITYINHDMDSTFVHGKVHRRKYLIDKKIRWNPDLTIHEDSYFNILCQNLSQNVKYCPQPFYLWKWRDESVCRHDPKYILKTYNNMIDSNEALISEFIKRKVMDKAYLFTAIMIFDAYYTMNKPEWINQVNKEYRDMTEKRFAKYYKDHKNMWNKLPISEKMQISQQIRGRSVLEGMQLEQMTVEEWLEHIDGWNVN